MTYFFKSLTRKNILSAGFVLLGYAQLHAAEEAIKQIVTKHAPTLTENNADEVIAFYDARKAFRECLLKKIKRQKNNFDIPKACEKSGHTYAMIAGKDAFNEMMENFRFACEHLS